MKEYSRCCNLPFHSRIGWLSWLEFPSGCVMVQLNPLWITFPSFPSRYILIPLVMPEIKVERSFSVRLVSVTWMLQYFMSLYLIIFLSAFELTTYFQVVSVTAKRLLPVVLGDLQISSIVVSKCSVDSSCACGRVLSWFTLTAHTVPSSANYMVPLLAQNAWVIFTMWCITCISLYWSVFHCQIRSLLSISLSVVRFVVFPSLF